MDKGSIGGVGSGTLGSLIPQGGFDDSTVDNAEEVVQDLGMQLEARLVKAVCKQGTDTLIGQTPRAMSSAPGSMLCTHNIATAQFRVSRNNQLTIFLTCQQLH